VAHGGPLSGGGRPGRGMTAVTTMASAPQTGRSLEERSESEEICLYPAQEIGDLLDHHRVGRPHVQGRAGGGLCTTNRGLPCGFLVAQTGSWCRLE
jgi:hypothetical protein